VRSGLNFTNIFTLSFYIHRSQKRKKTDDFTVFFTLLGSVSVKAVPRMLMKLSPEYKIKRREEKKIQSKLDREKEKMKRMGF